VLKIPALLFTPLLPVAIPVVYLILRAIRRLAQGLVSTMPTPEVRRLERAVKDAHAGPARDLVTNGLRITDPAIGRSLLLSALRSRYARDVVLVLLDAGAVPGDPEILALALASTTTELQPFLDHGADPNTVHPSGDPILFAAIEGGWTHNAIALVRAGADLSRRDREGWTVLMAHGSGKRGFGPGNWSGVADLLDKGADPKAPAPDGTTLADLFAKAGPYEIHPDRLAAIRKALGL
jgi:ankyrin repeat protein